MAAVSVSLGDRPAGAGPQQPEDRLIVNKRELAKQILNCSLPTINDLIDRYPDFPIVERGSNGVEWKFDAVDVVAFLAAKRQAETEEAETRADLFRQLTLPLGGGVLRGEQNQGPASGSQRLAGIKAELAKLELARKAGDVVDREALQQMMQGALGRLGRFLENLPTEIERRFNLPGEVGLAMRDRIDDARRDFVATIKPYLTE